MGYAISWLAVRGDGDTSVHASLGLEKTGQTEEFAESDWCSARLKDWTVVWSNSFEPKKFRNAASYFKGEVIVCDVEEHVMYASTSAFNDGSLIWRIVHDAQQAQEHLAVVGKPPDSLTRIQAEQFAQVGEDPDVDFIFEVPTRMAQQVVGFKHDETSLTVFDVLRDTSKSKPKWKFW